MSQGILKANLCLYANINYSLSNAFTLEENPSQTLEKDFDEIVSF